VVLPHPAVSRRHARIVRVAGKYYIEDLKTVNGTRVNNQKIDSRVLLNGNDRITITESVFEFLEQSPLEPALTDVEVDARALEDSSSAEVFEPRTPPTRDKLFTGERLDFLLHFLPTLLQGVEDERQRGNVAAECRQLREALQENHIHAVYPPRLYGLMCRDLQAPSSRARQILAEGFYRLVVLDMASGVGGDGEFDLEKFFEAAVAELVRVFDLGPGKDVMADDIAQILKDEPRSLFCFINVHRMPESHLRRVRGFTQELHQTLLLAEAQPERVFRTDSLSLHILDCLFHVFKQADRGFIIFAAEGRDELFPQGIRTRQGGDTGKARFSRHLVNKCIETAQALLGEEASSDQGSDLSQSIADRRIRSVMVAPLTVGSTGEAFGAIQLDTQDGGTPKKFTQDDLKLLLAVAGQAAVALENARLHEKLVAQARRECELKLAREVKRAFLPNKLPAVPGYEFFAQHEGGREASGDYYDFLPLPDGRLGVMLGAAAGKGVAAALLVANLSARARFCALTEPDLARMVYRLNELMQEAGANDRFVTLAAVLLEPCAHQATFANAGHRPPLLYRRASGKVEEAMPSELGGFPLGVAEGIPYESIAVALQPGDTVVVFTGGLEELAPDEVVAVIRSGEPTARAIGERLVTAARQHAQGSGQFDDITVVCFGRTA
jgi:serine phosphatase RsbU (regulator of sigma subunit)